MTENIANYHAERLAFKELVQPECERRILLFEGKSGSGKSTLLKHCRTHIPKESHPIPVDLRGTSLNLVGLFLNTTHQLKNESFAVFFDKLAELSGRSAVGLKNVAQWGNENQINVALQANNCLSREEQLSMLTHAWFSDMQAVQRQCVVMMDTFEQANKEIKEWVSGEFLKKVANSENLRVTVAGQSVPDDSRIEWAYCCQKWTLKGVKETEDWMKLVNELGRKVPDDNPSSFLRGICTGLNGNPKQIMEIIETFPRTS